MLPIVTKAAEVLSQNSLSIIIDRWGINDVLEYFWELGFVNHGGVTSNLHRFMIQVPIASFLSSESDIPNSELEFFLDALFQITDENNKFLRQHTIADAQYRQKSLTSIESALLIHLCANEPRVAFKTIQIVQLLLEQSRIMEDSTDSNPFFRNQKTYAAMLNMVNNWINRTRQDYGAVPPLSTLTARVVAGNINNHIDAYPMFWNLHLESDFVRHLMPHFSFATLHFLKQKIESSSTSQFTKIGSDFSRILFSDQLQTHQSLFKLLPKLRKSHGINLAWKGAYARWRNIHLQLTDSKQKKRSRSGGDLFKVNLLSRSDSYNL